MLNAAPLQALSNTAITFFVLWLMEKQVEVFKVGLLSMFFVCITLFMASHQLSSRPDFLLKMFDPSGVLVV